jgi:hypothetical protein
MRAPPLYVLLVAIVAAACAPVQPLQAVDPAQVVAGAPNEAQAELAGVTVHATIGGWRGEPKNLEMRLTPVDVTVQNSSNRTIRLGPEAFTLQTPSGARRAIPQNEAAWLLRDIFERDKDRFGPRIGAVRGPTFPGYDSPDNPNAPWARSPPGTPVPALARWYETQPAAGTLLPGTRASIMLFYGTPTRSLASATFEVELVDEQGTALGTVRLPFARD